MEFPLNAGSPRAWGTKKLRGSLQQSSGNKAAALQGAVPLALLAKGFMEGGCQAFYLRYLCSDKALVLENSRDQVWKSNEGFKNRALFQAEGNKMATLPS